jgi:gamma-glutamylcyclotransferase (GGCT)/AIG2-like uncharacterized protein YtfP
MNEFEFSGKGKMRAVMYDIGNYPGAVKENSANEVWGELYRIKNERKVLDALDRYENYDSENEKNCEYIRRKVRIRRENGSDRMAWVYWYNGNLESKQRIVDPDYLNYLKQKGRIEQK